MHDTALQIGRMAFEIYCGSSPAILELGSLDVNGSLRQFAPADARYVGVDFEAGPGVDFVTEPGASLPFDDDSFDMVVASSVLEHDQAFWNTFLDMCRKSRPGGVIYINVPTNGAVHRYPEDHWRFYPDSGKALARWAISQRQDVVLVESFVAPRADDIWNDFVAVFRKGSEEGAPALKLHLHEKVKGSMNIQIGSEPHLINHQPTTEDMALIATARDEVRRSNDMVAGLEQSAASLRTQLAEREHQLAQLESELRQRQEEIEQTARSAAEASIALQAALDTSAQRIAKLSGELAHEREWTFRLSGERTAAQNDARRAQAGLAAAERDLQDLRARLADRDQSLAASAMNLSDERAKLSDERAKTANLATLLGAKVAEVEREAEARRVTAAALADAEAQIAQRFSELVLITRMLSEQQDLNAEEKNVGDWLRRVYVAQDASDWRWRFMPRRWQAKQLHKRLARRGLFDADAYLNRHPDVAREGMDPLRHYILHGIQEGRKC